MKSAVAILALLSGASAFTTSPSTSARTSVVQKAALDDMYGNFDFRMKELNYDPVSVVEHSCFPGKILI